MRDHLDFSLEILVLYMSSATDPKELVSQLFNECQDLMFKLDTVEECKEVLIELNTTGVVEEHEKVPIKLNVVDMVEEGEEVSIELDIMEAMVKRKKISIELDMVEDDEERLTTPPPHNP